MKDVNVHDFNTKKIIGYASNLSVQDRIKYLKQVIIEYKGQSGVFDTQIGVGLRMPPTLHKAGIVKTLEEEIENSKKRLYISDNKMEKSSLQFEEALSVIDDIIEKLAEDPARSSEYLKKLQKRIHKIIDFME